VFIPCTERAKRVSRWLGSLAVVASVVVVTDARSTAFAQAPFGENLSLATPATSQNVSAQPAANSPAMNSFQTYDVNVTAATPAAPAPTGVTPVQFGMTLTPPQVFTNAQSPVQLPDSVASSYLQYNRRRLDESGNNLLRQIPRSSPEARHSPLYTFRPRFTAQAIEAAMPATPAQQTPPPAPALANDGQGGATGGNPGGSAAPQSTVDTMMNMLSSINPFTDASGKVMGRAAVYADTTHVTNAASGAFLPTNIPVEGQPFFGAPARANLSGSGSALNVTASNGTGSGTSSTDGSSSDSKTPVSATALITMTDAETGPSAALQQGWLQIGNVIAGSMETAFADPGSVPYTLDLAGPNARVTVGQNGQPGGQGRLGWFVLPMSSTGPGSEFSINLEQPQPEIINGSNAAPAKNLSTFSRYPDITAEYRYGNSIYDTKPYEETWHVQLAGVIRDLGLENANQTLERHETGWGLSLSGEYAWLTPVSPNVSDRLYGSVTYGQGIAHYISDLHSTSSAVGNDATLTNDRSLDALTTVAYYFGYTHNWTEYLRSTATYSHVTLDSINVTGQTVSPYRHGDYFAVNLVYHIVTTGPLFPPPALTNNPKAFQFYTGIEYLYGRKETLDGNAGDDQRIMWVTIIEN
jgi:hypothetical protein